MERSAHPAHACAKVARCSSTASFVRTRSPTGSARESCCNEPLEAPTVAKGRAPVERLYDGPYLGQLYSLSKLPIGTRALCRRHGWCTRRWVRRRRGPEHIERRILARRDLQARRDRARRRGRPDHEAECRQADASRTEAGLDALR